ncbi:FUSC family protein [Streptomyces sp. S1D4-11]
MTPGPGGGAIVRRSIQVTCSAGVGFYTFLYGLQQPVAALYALFTPIALGLLSTIPGTGRQQAWITLRTLPFGVVLVALGTALAVSTAAAVAGMLIVGFLLAFTVVAGPRTAGPARPPTPLHPRLLPAVRSSDAGRTPDMDQLASRSLTSVSPGAAPRTDRSSAALRERVARTCRDTGAALRAGERPPTADALDSAIRQFQAERIRRAADPEEPGADTGVLRRQATELTLAESTWIAVTALGVSAAGRRTSPLPPRELFWYADLPTTHLWARRIAGNATHRSVWFQNAVRVACGLAIARLVAGTLDLAHGFWVLLAVLTLGRTTVGATWRAVRQAMVGNLVGAVAAGALLIALGRHLDAYAVLLVPGMLIAFALGPRLGVAYAQGLFTLVVSLAFAQITPTSWRLSEARIVDVVTGSVIGLLCGLLA